MKKNIIVRKLRKYGFELDECDNLLICGKVIHFEFYRGYLVLVRSSNAEITCTNVIILPNGVYTNFIFTYKGIETGRMRYFMIPMVTYDELYAYSYAVKKGDYD